MSDNLELESVIEESINDAVNPEPEDTSVDTSPDTSVDEATTDVVTEEATPSDNIAGNTEPTVTTPEEDSFAKKFGLTSQSVTGRENRIPYSRVKKIVEKNERDTTDRITKELESKYSPKVTEYEAKIADYDKRWANVAQYENILENDQRTFLTMLSQHPKYAAFFQYVEKATAALEAQGTAATPAQEQPYLDSSTTPQPDQMAPDGQRYYSLEGLQKRDEWLARQIEAKAVAQAEERLAKRYAPMEQAWQSQEQINKAIPQVERQIAEARTWDKFPELEPKVVELLRADKNLSLERAYVKAYQEASVTERGKLSTDRNQMRTEILAELKKKPLSSTTPTSAVKASPTVQTGPRNLEDVIREELAEKGLLGT